MDKIDSPTLFLINIILSVILATYIFGFHALIVFGLIAAPTMLFIVISLFIEAGFGISPLAFFCSHLFRKRF